MHIGPIDLSKDILFIAEIGNNHEGNYDLAAEMIRLAAMSGAGAVKFQKIVPSQLVSVKQEARIRQLEKFRLSDSQYVQLSKVAQKEGVLFLCTPFDIESVCFLDSLVPAFKIASGDNNFFPLIEAVAKMGKPIILSSGLTDWEQIKKAKGFIDQVWRAHNIRQELAILHCVVSYPTEPKEANLLAIRELRKLDVTVGYSDHTTGVEAGILAVALGARILEKHFTVSKDYSDFRDHKISADPDEFRDLVQRVRRTEELLGDGVKRLQEAEKKVVQSVRRSIAANRDLSEGMVIAWSDLTWVRPGVGLPPGNESNVLGKKLKRPVAFGDPILPADLE